MREEMRREKYKSYCQKSDMNTAWIEGYLSQGYGRKMCKIMQLLYTAQAFSFILMLDIRSKRNLQQIHIHNV